MRPDRKQLAAVVGVAADKLGVAFRAKFGRRMSPGYVQYAWMLATLPSAILGFDRNDVIRIHDRIMP